MVLVVVIIAIGARYFILDRASVVSIKYDPLSSAVSKGLEVSGSNYLPIEGKDFKVSKVSYFDNNTWVVVGVDPIGNSADPATLVLHLVSGTYSTALGPLNSFNGVDLSGIPSDVQSYLIPYKAN